MTRWAIGDVQGCYDGLARLLDTVRFDPAADELWFVGDLVNRGGQSLEVLRLVSGLGDRVRAVLGNHDLHLLRRRVVPDASRPNAELDAVLAAPDADQLLAWLGARPFLHVDRLQGVALVHAGIHPRWSLAAAERHAAAAHAALRAATTPEAFDALWGLPGDDPEDENLRFVVSVFTRMRLLRRDGGLDLTATGPPEDAPPGCSPWYRWPGRQALGVRLFFGHWSALGLYVAPEIVALDTGYVWGGTLTAVDVDEPGRQVAVQAPRVLAESARR